MDKLVFTYDHCLCLQLFHKYEIIAFNYLRFIILNNFKIAEAGQRAEKILLYAGNSFINSPLVLIMLGTIYLFFFLWCGIKRSRVGGRLQKLFHIYEIIAAAATTSTRSEWRWVNPRCSSGAICWKVYLWSCYTTLGGNPYRRYIKGKEKEGQSAGNFGFSTEATAVTKNTYTNFKNLPLISEHVPNHNSNLTDDEFGYFLAGLIEGDGWFGKKELHIVFAEEDTSLAYYIKKRIGHGNVYKIKDKKAVRYICKNTNGLSLILYLINGKLVSNCKYDQLIKHNYSEQFNIVILSPLKALSLDNSWLAGFTQADGCFHISVAKSKTQKTGYSVRLEYSLKQNDNLPLKLLYDNIKMGNISQYSTGIWCYKSTGFKTAWTLINYFDKFNLFAGKYINYLKFRKVYIMITEGKHLEEKGIKKIISIATKGSSETSTQKV